MPSPVDVGDHTRKQAETALSSVPGRKMQIEVVEGLSDQFTAETGRRFAKLAGGDHVIGDELGLIKA